MTHLINPIFSERDRQAIIGTILGGSSIILPKGGTNAYLSMRGKNANWLEYKANECLKIFSNSKPFTIEKTNRWHSLCYPIFTEMRYTFYKKGNRNLTLKTLEESKLSDFGISIWLGDCGSIRDDNLILNTNVWGEDGTIVIKEFLKLIDIDSEIKKENKNNFRLILTDESKVRFISYADHSLPVFMKKVFQIR